MDIQKPKFKVVDNVRVLHFSSKGQTKKLKNYLVQKEGPAPRTHMVQSRDITPFSNEIFNVHEVLLGDPVVYKLYSPEAGVEILGKFYENELSLVRK